MPVRAPRENENKADGGGSLRDGPADYSLDAEAAGSSPLVNLCLENSVVRCRFHDTLSSGIGVPG